MRHSGYHWTIRSEGDRWRWRAVGADDGGLLVEGLARSRAEAALCLARTVSLATAGCGPIVA